MALPGDTTLNEKLRLGEVKDIYYYGSSTLEKQAIPTVQDTRFYQALNNLQSGSSTFVINPDQGVSDIILTVKLPAQGQNGADYTGLAVPKAWAYNLVRSYSIRYAGSSQYFWTGAQCLVENMRECTSPSTRDDLVALGGAEMKVLTDFAGDSLYAYVVLNFPHSSPNGSLEKPNPFPSELINQPIVVTLDLNPVNSIFCDLSGNMAPAGAPTSLAEAYFQVRQVHAHDAGALMRPMGGGAGYSFPLKAFYQNQIDVSLKADGLPQSIVLSGFRAGDVRSIFFWVTDVNDKKNPFNFVLPKDVVLTYNGTVYQNYKGTSSQIFELMNTETPSNFNNSRLDISGGAWVSTPVRSNWVNLPFSQIYEQLSASHLMVRGKMIENAVVNVDLTIPAKVGANYVLHAVYSYNSLLFCSAGSAEYIFG